jgi:deoxyribose-phosphate aldolase
MPPLVSYLDYTLLRPDATVRELDALCAQASEHRVAAVCVSPWMAERASRNLLHTSVKVCSVVGFPHGNQLAATKVQEAKALVNCGATELDLVWNLQAFRSGDLNYLRRELADVLQAVRPHGVLLKVIVETGLLTETDVRQAAQLCAQAGADFVKTSTGFNGPGAELEKVRLLSEVLPSGVRVKASGGIKTAEQARQFLEAGADRIGSSTLLVEE